MDGFVHLHLHSHYSLLDGAIRFDELLSACQMTGMDSLALTDHGNLFGAIEFYTAAVEAGVKPILGMEAYISPTSRTDRSMGNIQTAAYHLILLATNERGWRNLMKLSSRSYLEGFYYRPRVDRELLSGLNEGLICTTACLGGEVPTALLSGQQAKARRIAGEYKDIFGADRFFIEIQNQRLSDQDAVNPHLAALAADLGVGLVGTNDVHFLRREDKPAHEVLTCISTGKTLAEGGAIEYSPELYFKSAAEMRQALAAWPAAADNTLKIAEMCELKLDFSARYLPAFPTPSGKTEGEYLAELAWEGLRSRFNGRDVPEEYSRRLEWELKVLEDKGYSGYMLIVNDFVQYAHRNNIPATPRGSGVSALLGYALGMTDVDPVRYGLLFERFTDPARREAPDMDIDICQEGRAKVIQHVRQKYGQVAQVISFGTLKARAVVRDVGRVMDMPLGEVDAIAKKVPEGLHVTLQSALATEPELRELYDSDQRVRNLIDHGMKLEGLARHPTVHAAGVIIAQEALEDLVPLYKPPDSDGLFTQWDKDVCDRVGLMKMDFLGLRTLTTIQRARQLAAEQTGRDVDPERIPLDDQEVFELFRSGQTEGVFQFESEGMKNVLIQMQPTRIEDLIAANALYRPGPMELIPSYCARKNGLEPIPSTHPLVDEILAETYGVICYQEQVMRLLNRFGRLPLNSAYTLIKAISKKNHDVMAAARPAFIAGGEACGIDRQEVERLFDQILKFSGYGFNKAHSTQYAILAYRTAYFKAHYKPQFVAALLTFESGDTDKVVQYLAEAQREGVPVGPPDINTCETDFVVDGRGVRFGLAAVKGVGAKAVEAIVEARKRIGRFTDLYHFCQNVDMHAVNRSTLEALIKCGAFDALGAHRAAMMAALEKAMELGQAAAADRRSGQMNFFDLPDVPSARTAARFPDVEPWSEAQLLTAEKETLGFYITAHPLTRYGRELASLSYPPGASLANLASHPGARVTAGCMIASVRATIAKAGRSAGKKMAMLTVEDLTGKAEAVVFAEAYGRFAELIKPQAMVFLVGTSDRRGERGGMIVEQVIPIDQAIEELAGSILLRLPAGGAGEEFLRRLHDVLIRHKGTCPILLELRPAGRGDVRLTVRLREDWFVNPTRRLVDELVGLLGEENLLLRPRRSPGDGSNGNQARRNRPKPAQRPLIQSQARPDGVAP
jgi:DNA polymerase-3 subunit alpha